jgi:hypothetical protein
MQFQLLALITIMLRSRAMLHSKTLSRIASRKFAITIVFILKDKKPRPPAQQNAGAVGDKHLIL